MQDHRIAGPEMFDRRPDLPHPSCVLVPEGVRQPDVGLLRPLALDDVQVGPARRPDQHSTWRFRRREGARLGLGADFSLETQDRLRGAVDVGFGG